MDRRVLLDSNRNSFIYTEFDGQTETEFDTFSTFYQRQGVSLVRPEEAVRVTRFYAPEPTSPPPPKPKR